MSAKLLKTNVRDAVIVAIVFSVSFLAAGGWRFLVSSEEIDLLLYRSPSLYEQIIQCLCYFIFDGGAIASIAAVVTLKLLQRRRRSTLRDET
jgi:hypothetical protein